MDAVDPAVARAVVVKAMLAEQPLALVGKLDGRERAAYIACP